jgi:hypothetical protein
MGRKPKIKVADAGGGGEAESSAVYDAKKLVGKRMVGGRIEYKGLI